MPTTGAPDRIQMFGNSLASEASSSAIVVSQAVSLHLTQKASPDFRSTMALPEGRSGGGLVSPAAPTAAQSTLYIEGGWDLQQEL